MAGRRSSSEGGTERDRLNIVAESVKDNVQKCTVVINASRPNIMRVINIVV
jgi:hypothetical protein